MMKLTPQDVLPSDHQRAIQHLGRDDHLAARVEHAPAGRTFLAAGQVVQALIELAQRRRREVDHLHGGPGGDSGRHQTGVFSQT